MAPTFITLFGMETITFESPHNIALKLGDSFRFDLPYVGGTGYQWEWSDQELLEMIEEEYKSKSDAPGGGGRMLYTFKAKQKGTAAFELFYWQPWCGKESVEKNLRIELTVQ